MPAEGSPQALGTSPYSEIRSSTVRSCRSTGLSNGIDSGRFFETDDDGGPIE